MASKYPARPDLISRDGIPITDDWGSTFTLDRIDSFSARPITNNVLARFSPMAVDSGYRWTTDAVLLEAGAWQGYDRDELSGFAHVQFKRATAGASATLDLRMNCKGG